MIRKLQVKIVCLVMAIVTVMMVVIFSMFFRFTQKNLEQSSLQLLRMSDNKQHSLSRPGEGPGQNAPCFSLEWGPSGVLIATGEESYDLSDTEALQQILTEAEQTEKETGVLKDYALRFLRSNSPKGNRYVFTDISTEIQTLTNLGWICTTLGIFGFAGFLVVSIFLARWLTRPVTQSLANQRQFVADASHELKTPLTVILTNTELLQQPEYDSSTRSRFTDNILTTAKQMRGLVESLLELARVDNGQVKAAVVLLDYSKLVSDAVLPFEPMYFEKGLMLESQVEPGLRVSGNERYLNQVVGILLDNGLKYASDGGTVRLELRRNGRGHCLLSVASPGVKLSVQELRDIFKRFYQVDKARNMDHSYGLGLSIAEQIVREHGGKIWAESRDGINTFFVTLAIC